MADLNGDGKPDLAVANAYNYVTVLLGNGDGTFGAATPYGTGSYPEGIAAGDINGDGKPDLVVSAYFGVAAGVLLGNGDGTFQAPVYYAAGNGPQGVAMADFNGDGRTDIAVVNSGSANVSVLLGLAPTGGLLTTATALRSSANPSTASQTLSLTAEVSPSTATGTVTFKDGSTVVGTTTIYGGSGSTNVGGFAVGSHSLTAVYSGDANDAASTSAVLLQVVNQEHDHDDAVVVGESGERRPECYARRSRGARLPRPAP